MQLASKAHASNAAVGGGLDCNLSNWLGRFHQINKIREKCRREEGVATTSSSNTPTAGVRMPHRASLSSTTLSDAGATASNTPAILSDFTTYT